MILLPAIDLKGGKCVRLTEGRVDTAKVYDADPLAVARRWADAGAAWIHVVDLDGALGGARTGHWEIAARIAGEFGIPVQFGGGVRSPDAALRLLDRGISRIVLGTLAARDPESVAPLLREGGDRVAVGLDARDGMVRVAGWEADSGRRAVDLAKTLALLGAKRVIYTDIARDGTLGGPNLAATRELAEAAGVAVTASGGVATLDDLRALAQLGPYGVDSAIVGKALYEGRFTLAEALALLADIAADAAPDAGLRAPEHR
jgi:phosphoribosylformimino-5-aminoimidazole carboxamide ribotide isomerase